MFVSALQAQNRNESKMKRQQQFQCIGIGNEYITNCDCLIRFIVVAVVVVCKVKERLSNQLWFYSSNQMKVFCFDLIHAVDFSLLSAKCKRKNRRHMMTMATETRLCTKSIWLIQNSNHPATLVTLAIKIKLEKFSPFSISFDLLHAQRWCVCVRGALT